MEKEYIVGKAVENALPDKYVSGVKGDKEGVYRTGDVNLTPANIGAEPEITKNTAFNKDFGTAEGTVCEGNDSRLNNLLPDSSGAINAGGRKSGSTVGANSVGIGKNCEAGSSSIAIGKDCKAVINSIVIGPGARGDGADIAIGPGASSRGDYSIGIGYYCDTPSSNSISIGYMAKARTNYAIAIGDKADAAKQNCIAIGEEARALEDFAAQIGRGTNNARSTLQFYSKRIADTGGNLYQNNVKLQELYEPLLDVTKLVPSIENGWTQGSLSTNLQGFEKGEYYVFCTEYAIDGSSTILSSSTSILVTGKAFESFDFSLSSGSGGTLHIFGTSGLTAYLYDWVSNSRKKVASAALWFKKK